MSIPVGMRAGQQIRLMGQGSPSLHGGASGDPYLTLPVTPWETALGAEVLDELEGWHAWLHREGIAVPTKKA